MLHLAAQAGRAEVVRLVIDDYKLSLTACNNVSEYQAKLVFESDIWCVVGCPISVTSVTVSRVDHVGFKSFTGIIRTER